MSVDSLTAKGHRTGKSPWVERLGRAGLVAKGVLYGVVGILALKIAFGADEENADQEGALRDDRRAAVRAWPPRRPRSRPRRLRRVATRAGSPRPGRRGRRRQGPGETGRAVGKAVLYGALCALTVAEDRRRRHGQSGSEDKATAGVLGLPLGRYLVFAVAAGSSARPSSTAIGL